MADVIRCVLAELGLEAVKKTLQQEQVLVRIAWSTVKEEEVSKFEFRKGQERVPTVTSSMSKPPNTPLNECNLNTRNLNNFWWVDRKTIIVILPIHNDRLL